MWGCVRLTGEKQYCHYNAEFVVMRYFQMREVDVGPEFLHRGNRAESKLNICTSIARLVFHSAAQNIDARGEEGNIHVLVWKHLVYCLDL